MSNHDDQHDSYCRSDNGSFYLSVVVYSRGKIESIQYFIRLSEHRHIHLYILIYVYMSMYQSHDD